MAHFGIICPPISGHVDPLAAVGGALIRRGHRVTIFHVQDLESKAVSSGLGFVPLGTQAYPPGALTESVAKLSRLTGWASLKFAIECECLISELILRDGPDAIRNAGVNALLVDQKEPAGGAVAEYLKLPFLSMCTASHLIARL